MFNNDRKQREWKELTNVHIFLPCNYAYKEETYLSASIRWIPTWFKIRDYLS